MALWLIPILPFIGFLVNGLFGRRMPKAAINLFAIGSVALSFAWAVKTLLGLGALETKYVEHYFTWIQSGNLLREVVDLGHILGDRTIERGLLRGKHVGCRIECGGQIVAGCEHPLAFSGAGGVG